MRKKVAVHQTHDDWYEISATEHSTGIASLDVAELPVLRPALIRVAGAKAASVLLRQLETSAVAEIDLTLT